MIETYYERNKEKLKEYYKGYYLKNREEINKRQKEWSENNKDKISNSKKKYYKENIDKIKVLGNKNKNQKARWSQEYRKTGLGRYSLTKSSAKCRNIKFNITREDFINWFEKQKLVCCYCNKDLRYISDIKNKLNSLSIDRIDNELGYEITNICICCNACNLIKGNRFSYKEMRRIGELINDINIGRLIMERKV